MCLQCFQARLSPALTYTYECIDALFCSACREVHVRPGLSGGGYRMQSNCSCMCKGEEHQASRRLGATVLAQALENMCLRQKASLQFRNMQGESACSRYVRDSKHGLEISKSPDYCGDSYLSKQTLCNEIHGNVQIACEGRSVENGRHCRIVSGVIPNGGTDSQCDALPLLVPLRVTI